MNDGMDTAATPPGGADAPPRGITLTPATPTAPKGVAVIEQALQTMPLSPGVYRMLDARGEALYVGKAKSLKKRVYSYTQTSRLNERLRRMVSDTVTMEIVTTHTEAEALLLEANLIKRLKPRFNIVLRDDKSYPWLVLTEDHPFPQIAKHRGSRTRKGSYYGPFASVWSVNQTVNAMQRVFLLRSSRTPCSPTAAAPACCTRSSAALPPAPAASARPITPASSARPGLSWAARPASSKSNSPSRWKPPPSPWSSSVRRPCATASGA